jgi:hypothetical protein
VFASANGSTISAPIGRVSLAASSAQQGLLFALVADGGNTRDIFRSTDGAASWTSIDGGPDAGWGQAFHTNAIASHPDDPALLIVAQGGAKLTRDALAAQPTWASIDAIGHADTARLAWDADGQLWAANDGGLFRLDLDAGTANDSRNAGLTTLQVFAPGALTLDPDGAPRAWIGLQDNGLVRAELAPLPRLVLRGGCCDGGWVSAARGVSGRVAAMLGIPFDQYLSNNAGDSFSRMSCLPPHGNGNTPLAFDPAPAAGSPPLLYSAMQAPGGNGVLLRTDLARPCAFSTTSFAIPDPASFAADFISIAPDPERLVLLLSPQPDASDRRHAIARSLPGLRNSTLTVERQPSPRERSGRIASDPGVAGRLWWWSLDGAPVVLRSERYGAEGSWVDVTGDLDGGGGLRIRRVIGHPRDPALAWVATSLGVLHTDDGGQHWRVDHGGLPVVVDAVDLALRASTSLEPGSVRLWLATYGHGLWQRELLDDLVLGDGFESGR